MDIRNGMNLGAEDYLTKPISPDELLLAISSKLQKQNNHIRKITEMNDNIISSLPIELQQPLSNIISNANLLKNELNTQTNNKFTTAAPRVKPL